MHGTSALRTVQCIPWLTADLLLALLLDWLHPRGYETRAGTSCRAQPFRCPGSRARTKSKAGVNHCGYRQTHSFLLIYLLHTLSKAECMYYVAPASISVPVRYPSPLMHAYITHIHTYRYIQAGGQADKWDLSTDCEDCETHLRRRMLRPVTKMHFAPS